MVLKKKKWKVTNGIKKLKATAGRIIWHFQNKPDTNDKGRIWSRLICKKDASYIEIILKRGNPSSHIS